MTTLNTPLPESSPETAERTSVVHPAQDQTRAPTRAPEEQTASGQPEQPTPDPVTPGPVTPGPVTPDTVGPTSLTPTSVVPGAAGGAPVSAAPPERPSPTADPSAALLGALHPPERRSRRDLAAGRAAPGRNVISGPRPSLPPRQQQEGRAVGRVCIQATSSAGRVPGGCSSATRT